MIVSHRQRHADRVQLLVDQLLQQVKDIMRGIMDCFGITDVGQVRERNEDQFLIADLRKSVVIHHSSLNYDDETQLSGASRAKLLMVADGVGGHNGGDRASQLAVDTVVRYLLNDVHWPMASEENRESQFFAELTSALEFSEQQIRYVADRRPEQRGMGTTLTMAWVIWPNMYLMHVGDSRAYLFRDGSVRLLSHDQTLAQMLADRGAIAESDVEGHPFAHVLFSALGCGDELVPFFGRTELQAHDKVLLCTDGLTRHLSSSRIAEILAEDDTAEVACQRLVNAANEGGGRDNVTVALARFTTWSAMPDETASATAAAEHQGDDERTDWLQPQ